MALLLDILVFLKKKNFTVTKEFSMGNNGIILKEYVYNMSRYLTDVWPPVTSAPGFPIQSVIREKDGLDITKRVIQFSGPKKNYVNPLATYTKKRRVSVSFINLGIRISVENSWEPYEGNIIVTDTLGIKKVICVNKNGGVSHISP